VIDDRHPTQVSDWTAKAVAICDECTSPPAPRSPGRATPSSTASGDFVLELTAQQGAVAVHAIALTLFHSARPAGGALDHA
jgi:hypothetical protein